jgi:asparagine synthase (glutamine-hydrolysing)
MCGIAAIFVYHTGAPVVEEGELVSIRDAMASRGPDGAGLWYDPTRRVGLGHRRLSIIDVSTAGHQPMLLPEQKLAITFNGEIYNYRELRAGLEKKGHRFRSTCDTEVLLHLYAEEGEAMLAKLRGMYAFAVWDGVKQVLFLARDPFGIKPLYYADDGKTFRAASQVKALLVGGKIDTSPEPAGHVGYFLWGHVPGPYTLYRGIRGLSAGHCLTVEAGGKKRLRAFCRIPDILAEAEHDEAERRQQKPEVGSRKSEVCVSDSQFSASRKDLLASALHDTIRHHLIADVPVGVFLSSGLDSSTITALASECGGELRTVTLGFEEYKGTPNDETPLAEKVALHYGTRHQTIWVTRRDFENELNNLFHAMDQPSSDGVNSYFISKAAAQAGLKVALSGLGGDELFGGYAGFQEIPRLVGALERFQHGGVFGRMFRAVSAPMMKHMTSPKYAGLLEYGGTYGGAYLLRRGMFMPWELPEILDGEVVKEGWKELKSLVGLERTANGLRSPHLKISALEMSWYMRHQLLRDADWASMAHSLEVRVPLVDTELLRETAPLFAREPHPTKRDMGMAPRLPLPDLVLNRSKTGFTVPIRDWLLARDLKAESRTPQAGNHAERGLRGWARLVHDRFNSGVSTKAIRVAHRASQPSFRHIDWGTIAANENLGGNSGPLRSAPALVASGPSPSDPRHILIFRIGQLGDTIISLPAMQAVRRRYPDARFTLLCDRHPGKSYVLASDLLGRGGLFDEILSYPVRDELAMSQPWSIAPVLAAIRSRKCDTLAYLAPSGRSPAQINRDRRFFVLAGVKHFIGMKDFAILPEKVSGKPLPQVPSEADLLLDRLRADGIPVPAPGQACADLRLGLAERVEVADWLGQLCSDKGRAWIGVAPGSKMPAKRWPEERFRDVVAQLAEEFEVWPVVFGGSEDAAMGRRLLSAWRCGYNAAGELSLRGSAAALRHCVFLLTNDTGTMHLAAAVDVPCVAVFSARAAPGLWCPQGRGHQVFRAQIDCEGCGLLECIERKNECLQRITVEQVLAGCRSVLKASPEKVKHTRLKREERSEKSEVRGQTSSLLTPSSDL